MGQVHRLQADLPTCQLECVLFLIVTEKTAIYMPGINPKSEMRPRVSFWSQKVIFRFLPVQQPTSSYASCPPLHVFAPASSQAPWRQLLPASLLPALGPARLSEEAEPLHPGAHLPLPQPPWHHQPGLHLTPSGCGALKQHLACSFWGHQY